MRPFGTRSYTDTAARAERRLDNSLRVFFLQLGSAKKPLPLFLSDDMLVGQRGTEAQLVGTYTRDALLADIRADIDAHIASLRSAA